MPCCAVLCSAVLCCALLCRAVLCCTVRCCALPYSTVLLAISKPLLLSLLLLSPLTPPSPSPISPPERAPETNREKTTKRGARHVPFVYAAHHGCLNNSVWAASVQDAAPSSSSSRLACTARAPALCSCPFCFFKRVQPRESPLVEKRKKKKKEIGPSLFLFYVSVHLSFRRSVSSSPPVSSSANRTE